MNIIDLSLPLYSGMPVFPWDPEVSIEPNLHIEKDGWNMSRIEMNSHDGTHLNVPFHSEENWKKLDDYTLIDFMGVCLRYESENDIQENIWLIFSDQNITQEIAEKLIEKKVKFVWLSHTFEVDIHIEKYLLHHSIISYERLYNTEKLPKKFFFHGAPLHIKNGDGSPVRAYALCYE